MRGGALRRLIVLCALGAVGLGGLEAVAHGDLLPPLPTTTVTIPPTAAAAADVDHRPAAPDHHGHRAAADDDHRARPDDDRPRAADHHHGAAADDDPAAPTDLDRASADDHDGHRSAAAADGHHVRAGSDVDLRLGPGRGAARRLGRRRAAVRRGRRRRPGRWLRRDARAGRQRCGDAHLRPRYRGVESRRKTARRKAHVRTRAGTTLPVIHAARVSARTPGLAAFYAGLEKALARTADQRGRRRHDAAVLAGPRAAAAAACSRAPAR